MRSIFCEAVIVGAVLAVVPVDGDTLKAGDCRLRLLTIDAPELRGPCPEIAAQARQRLADLAGGIVVITAMRGRDRYGRPLVMLASDQAPDLGDAMIRQGMARRYRPGVREWCPTLPSAAPGAAASPEPAPGPEPAPASAVPTPR